MYRGRTHIYTRVYGISILHGLIFHLTIFFLKSIKLEVVQAYVPTCTGASEGYALAYIKNIIIILPCRYCPARHMYFHLADIVAGHV